MTEILQDYHHWSALCYEEFVHLQQDPISKKQIREGFFLVHDDGYGMAIHVDEYEREALHNLLTDVSYESLDYLKIIYMLRKACYINGFFRSRIQNFLQTGYAYCLTHSSLGRCIKSTLRMV